MKGSDVVFWGLTIDQLIRIAIGALILIIGIVLIKVVMRIIRRVLKKSDVNEDTGNLISKLFKAVLIIILVFTLMSHFGISLTPIATLIGFASGAVIFALQGCVANIAGGMMIHTNKPFIAGDLVDISGSRGTVVSTKLFHTILRTGDNKIITIPNSNVITATLVNETTEKERRVDLCFKIDSSSDVEKVKKVLVDVAKNCHQTIREDEIFTGISGYDGGAVNVELKVWCKTEDYNEVSYFLQEEVRKQFQKNEIVLV